MNRQSINTIASILRHGVSILCGLILPHEILAHYGSEMNGLAHAISQFISYTVLLELGIGAVIPAALYQPLATGDNRRISAILSSGNRVFRRIAWIMLAYILVLASILPFTIGGTIPPITVLMVLGCISLGSVAHYIAGTPESLLLISDQRGYIVYGISIATMLVSTILQVFLIRMGCVFAVVKLTASVIAILHIFLICLYVRRHYRLEKKVRYTDEPIPQKWDGAAQHVAYFILENTDIILLTLLVSLKEVSVYSVYFMVINGIRSIFSTVSYNVQPKLGELQAKGETEQLKVFFASFEQRMHLIITLAFGLMGILLIPFIQAYTSGIEDVNYVRPAFAILMSLAYGFQCVRDPYDKLILASGHFKQTRHNYIIAASLNMIISIIGILFLGLEGAAIGTLVAMVYQFIFMMIYDSKVFLRRSVKPVLKLLLMDAVIILPFIFIGKKIQPTAFNIISTILGNR